MEISPLQGRRSRGGLGGQFPPKYRGGGAQPPLALHEIINKFNLLARIRMKRRQVLLHESCPFRRKIRALGYWSSNG